MKKMNILFILITTILIFGTTNAYAMVYEYNVGNEFIYNSSSYDKNITLVGGGNSGYYQEQFTFDSPFTSSINGYGRFYYISSVTKDISYQNYIDFDSTCSNYIDEGHTGFVVHYADSSTATITSNDYGTICNSWNGTNNTINDYDIALYQFAPKLQIYDSNNKSYICEMENGFIFCPLEQNKTYNKMVMTYYHVNSSKGNIKYYFRLDRYGNYIQTDTQKIIDNNNQNTETIVNNITTPTIDSNTTNTDSLITIPNSNGKNVVLDLLMTPVNLFTNIVNSFSNSCVSYNLGNLLGTDLILPCVNLHNILGSSLYTIIDSIFAFGMLFAFIRSVKRFIQKALLLASDVSSEVSVF